MGRPELWSVKKASHLGSVMTAIGCAHSCGVCKCMKDCNVAAFGLRGSKKPGCAWRCPPWIAPGSTCSLPSIWVNGHQGCKDVCTQGIVEGEGKKYYARNVP